jgi:hypothetical protein
MDLSTEGMSMPLRLTKLLIVLLAHLAGTSAFADLTVFDVRKNFPMTNGEKTFKDYYINGGAEMGIKQGMVITVNRRRALYDAYQNKSLGNLKVPVGKLKVIHVQNGVSVARLFSSFSRENIPGLEFDFILVGDQLDMASAYMSKKSAKKSAELQREKPRRVASSKEKEPEMVPYLPQTEELPATPAFKQPDLDSSAVH